jgi:uncharacterized protein YbjT (DUF2867 family)
VVAELLDAGETVRAISRNPERAAFPGGVDVVRADLTQPETLPAALRGVDRAFLFPAAGRVAGFLDAATGAGLQRVVLLSSAAADADGGASATGTPGSSRPWQRRGWRGPSCVPGRSWPTTCGGLRPSRRPA